MNLVSQIHENIRSQQFYASSSINEVAGEYFILSGVTDAEQAQHDKALFDALLASAVGTSPISSLRRSDCFRLCKQAEKVTPGSGERQLNILRKVLSFAQKGGARKSNPLANVTLDLKAYRENKPLTVDQLFYVLEAAKSIGQQWSDMIALFILSGEPLEDVRRIRGCDINWDKGIWNINRPWQKHRSPGQLLTAECRGLLKPYEGMMGLLFQDPAEQMPEPVSVSEDMLLQLRAASGVDGFWTLKQITHVTSRNWGEPWRDLFSFEIEQLRRIRSKHPVAAQSQGKIDEIFPWLS